MLEQAQVVALRRRRSHSITLVLIASSAMVAGCDQRVSAGDIAYHDRFGSADDCRRDYGDNCTYASTGASGRGGYYGPYIVNSGSRPAPSPNSVGVEQTVLSREVASRINSGAESARGGFTSRGGFGGGEGGGGEGGGGE